MSAPVAITGLGILSTFGASSLAFRDALLNGDSGIGTLTEFDVSRCRTRVAVPVRGIDATRWIPPMKLRRLDRTGIFALAAVREALADAGLDDTVERDDAGVVIGTYSAGGEATQDYLTRLHASGPTGAPALIFHSTVGNAAASLAGLECKLRGPNVTISQKEASGLAAIGTAIDLLRESRADLVVAGGVDAISEMFFRAHDRFDVMSPGGIEDAVSAPFDQRRNGFLMGEGGFMLTLQHAGDDAVPPSYGTLVGLGVGASDAGVNGWPDSPAGIERTLAMALDDAGLRPDGIDVVFASANSTPALDRVEGEAIRRVFGSRPLVTSVKGALGECGASGAASCAAAVLCAAAGRVPPVAGLIHPDGAFRAMRVVSNAAPWTGSHVLVNAIGSGGSLVSVVIDVSRRERP